jgi:hypothetical protein
MPHHVDSSKHGSSTSTAVARERRSPPHRAPKPPHIHADSFRSKVRTNAVPVHAERRHRTWHAMCTASFVSHWKIGRLGNHHQLHEFCRREGHGHLRPQAPPKAQPPILAQVPVLQDSDQPTGERCARKACSHRRGNASVYAESLRYQYSGSGAPTCLFRPRRS